MKHFSISELCTSSKAIACKTQNLPGKAESNALLALVDNVLDPLRTWYGKSITVNSGYRDASVNKAVGGATGSQHMKGEAADITAGNKAENEKLYNFIRDNLVYDQLINEQGFKWVHVSYTTTGKNRKQQLAL